ncbi:MAG: PilZ domain-containing protein [Kofleriaceae bacterium]
MSRPGTEREPRYAHEASITLRARSTVIEGRTRNVSRGGVCASLPTPLQVGCEVQVELALVFDGEVLSDAFKIKARIVWCTMIDESYQLGVAFHSIDARQSDHLATFLKLLDGEQPSGKQRKDLDQAIDDRFG